ncbi:amidohydrolase [Fretibacterium sp. OH1220_COT-178]|uniref:amidohydrolase n=1 Tax=Fretibacterium sp. OH1220_COT-178 TaxID=2491047 RepID=UPI000F5EF2AE|nr:amidohydrolase [Fretibacterium sp. OH1220_COT-178]RRD66007.1 M20 family peptidase [Fretibacterium sp. OH1220_COT-178]
MKDKIVAAIDAHANDLKDLARAIFSYEETAFQEKRSSKALADYLRRAGFEVEWGPAGLETAFVAKFGRGRPHIGLMGEYDALPEVGHACGHNMIGTISAGAAAAVKASGCLEGREGTILFLGCPAEEHGGGKVLLAEAGVFDGLDAAMIVHPTSISTGYDISFAIKRLYVEFFGRAAHAAAAPHKGINALDAMIAFFNGVALMRQQTTERTRIHGIILNGGQSFNTIPDYTKAEMGIRALRMEEVLELEERLAAVAEGAARAAGCTAKVTQAEAPQPEVYVNVPLARTLDANYALVGERTTMRTYGQGVGSTDVGIVTQKVPGIQGYIDITDGAPVPTHSREFAAAANSDYGYDAMIRATKALALTAFDLFADPVLLDEVRQYFRERRRDF